MSKNQLEVVRIRDDRGEYNATRAHADRIGATVLDRKATHDDRTGLPVPGKPVTDLAGKPADPTPTPTTLSAPVAAGKTKES